MFSRSGNPKNGQANKLLSLLASRKFWLAVTAILVPVLNRKLDLGLDPIEVGSALAVIAAVIIGIAWEDAARNSKTGPSVPPSSELQADSRPDAGDQLARARRSRGDLVLRIPARRGRVD